MHPLMPKTQTLLMFHRAFHIKRTSSICSKKSILLLFYFIQQQTSAQCKENYDMVLTGHCITLRGIIPSHLASHMHMHLFLLECVINYYQRQGSPLSLLL